MDDSPTLGSSSRCGTVRLHPTCELSETAEGHKLIRVCSITCRALVDEATHLLHRQWPRGGSVEQYRIRCFAPRGESDKEVKSGPQPPSAGLLPCSYLLVDASSTTLLAHGRLTECYDDSGGGSGAGRAAAVTYVVVEPSIRGKGVGGLLMHQLETEALRLNYQYLYLWTHTAIGFYEALGYVACHRVSLHRDCLKALAPEQVSNLESALSKRFGAKRVSKDEGSAAGTDRRSETILLPPEDGCSSQDVWMRKRLVEELDPVPVSAETRVEEVRQYVREREAATGVPLAWEYFLVPLAYHPQVGPSCGLAAIRVVRDRYKSSSEAYDAGNMSLLQLTQNLGMTVDGELFDTDDLGCLIQRVCRLDNVLVQSFPSIDEITSILVERNGLIVLPYDSHPGTRLPFLNSGRSAHWGVVVGVLHGLPKEGSTEFDIEPTLTPLNGRHFDLSEAAETILLVQHGLSRKLAIAPYEDIRSSNAQLSAVDSRKFHVRNLNLLDRVVIVGPNSE